MTPDLSDEQEIFASTDTPAETVTETIAAPVVETEEENETDATESGEPDSLAEAGTQEREPKRVSYGALKEEREWRKQLQQDAERREKQWAEERAQMMRAITERTAPPQPNVQAQPEVDEDPLSSMVADPVAWAEKQFASRVTPIEQREFETRMHFSSRLASIDYGKETVSAAKTALEQAVAAGTLNEKTVEAQLRASPDPWGDIVKWHQQNTVISEVGNDPAAYEAKVRAKILAEMQGTAPAQQAAPATGAAPTIQAPPSLLRAAGNAGIAHGGSITEEDIFNSAPAFGKKRA